MQPPQAPDYYGATGGLLGFAVPADTDSICFSIRGTFGDTLCLSIQPEKSSFKE